MKLATELTLLLCKMDPFFSELHSSQLTHPPMFVSVQSSDGSGTMMVCHLAVLTLDTHIGGGYATSLHGFKLFVQLADLVNLL